MRNPRSVINPKVWSNVRFDRRVVKQVIHSRYYQVLWTDVHYGIGLCMVRLNISSLEREGLHLQLRSPGHARLVMTCSLQV